MRALPRNGALSNGFRRSSLTVLIGSALGHLVGLALTPAIARIYGPGTFGAFASAVAAASVFVGISTFRLEVLAQRAVTDSEARPLIRLAVRSNVGWGLAISVGSIAVTVATGELLWLSTGALVMVASLQLIGSGVLTRERDYRRLAGANFLQGAGAGSTQVTLGLLAPTTWSLLAGFVLSRTVWLGPIAHFLPGDRAQVDRPGVRRYATTAGPSALINSLGGEAPILLASVLFGSAGAGLLAMAVRLLIGPLGIVGQAAAAGTLGEVGSIVRGNAGSARQTVRRAMRDLSLLGVLPCAAAAGLGPVLVPLLLGTEWTTTGTLIALLSVGALAQLVVSPFAQLLNLLGRSRLLLGWDIARVVLICVAWVAPWLLGASFEAAVGIYSATLVAVYFGLWRLLEVALRNH